MNRNTIRQENEMSFVRTGLPELRVSGREGPRETQVEAPFLDHTVLDQDLINAELNRRQAVAGRWQDIAGACAITLCVCAWIAIRIAAD
jgi:hypothetical protein